MELALILACIAGLVISTNIHKDDLRREEALKQEVMLLSQIKHAKKPIEVKKVDGVIIANLGQK